VETRCLVRSILFMVVDGDTHIINMPLGFWLSNGPNHATVCPRKYAKHQASPQLKKIAHKAMHFISFDNDPRFDQIRPTMIDCDPRWPPRGGQRTKHKIRNCVVPSCQCQQSLEYPNQHGGDTYGTQCNIDRGFV
jgi:hypothetical protein